MARLAWVIMLVMVALLIHSPAARERVAWQLALVRMFGLGLPAIRAVRLFFKNPQLLLMSLRALHDLLLLACPLLERGSLVSALSPWVMGMVGVVLASAAGNPGVLKAFSIRA